MANALQLRVLKLGVKGDGTWACRRTSITSVSIGANIGQLAIIIVDGIGEGGGHPALVRPQPKDRLQLRPVISRPVCARVNHELDPSSNPFQGLQRHGARSEITEFLRSFCSALSTSMLRLMLGHPLLVSPNKLLKLRVGGLGSDSERRPRALPLLVPCLPLAPESPQLEWNDRMSPKANC
jgi:hypothetical protein